MEKQEITALTVIDLLTAFNTIDHQVLIGVLKNKFGIDGVALKWYKAYLYARCCQKLCLKGDRSSFLGPTKILSWHKSVLSLCLNSAGGDAKGIDVHGFADDHGYKNSFPANSRDKETARMKNLKNVLETSRNEWMRTSSR